MDKYLFPKKSELKRIKISDVNLELPDLKNPDISKAAAIAHWLSVWIEQALAAGKIGVNDILPSKPEFAYKLGVSIGTVQNAFKRLEDIGCVESKQCIGTIVKDYKETDSKSLRKLVSKRDLAIDAIKRYIQTGGFKVGSVLPSSYTIAVIIGYTQNTTRMAMEYLHYQKIIRRKQGKTKNNSWIVNTMDFETSIPANTTSSETLVTMLVKDLETYIEQNMNVGDKLPSHLHLANLFKVSVKTIHDALQNLAERGIIQPKRGAYGTTIIKIPNDKSVSLKPENSIFAPAKDAAFYHYEKTQNHIKKLIATEYQVGDKLPSIKEMAKQLDLSHNTIRKAFHNLAKEGYLVFSRGRYGGTFIIDIPEIEAQAFKWIALNPAYVGEGEQISN